MNITEQELNDKQDKIDNLYEMNRKLEYNLKVLRLYNTCLQTMFDDFKHKMFFIEEY